MRSTRRGQDLPSPKPMESSPTQEEPPIGTPSLTDGHDDDEAGTDLSSPLSFTYSQSDISQSPSPREATSSPSALGANRVRSFLVDVNDPDNDYTAVVGLGMPADDDAAVLVCTPTEAMTSQTLELDSNVEDAGDFQRRKRKASQVRGSMNAKKSRRKKIRASAVVCHRCYIDDTPMWRPGPEGPGTLCNVCGLLYSRRQRRKAGDRKMGKRSSGGCWTDVV